MQPQTRSGTCLSSLSIPPRNPEVAATRLKQFLETLRLAGKATGQSQYRYEKIIVHHK